MFGTKQFDAPDERRDQCHHRRETERLKQEIGKDRADGPDKIPRLHGRGMGEAWIEYRPGCETRPDNERRGKQEGSAEAAKPA